MWPTGSDVLLQTDVKEAILSEGERGTNRDRQTEGKRERDRQIDRQTEGKRETDRERERARDRQTCCQTEKHAARERERQRQRENAEHAVSLIAIGLIGVWSKPIRSVYQDDYSLLPKDLCNYNRLERK